MQTSHKKSFFNKTLAFSLVSFVLGAGVAVPATSIYIKNQIKKSNASAAPIKKPAVKIPSKVNLNNPPIANQPTK